MSPSGQGASGSNSSSHMPQIPQWLLDKIHGTHFYTEGAEIQLPRKIPMRVEPKSYFALERTFLSWVSMAVTMGSVSSVLMSFTNPDAHGEQEQRISRRTIDVITCIYAPLGMIILAYALWTYEIRSKFMRKKQFGMLDERMGPTIIAGMVLVTLMVIFTLALYDFFY
mmetsp:Transcript_24197/g.66235  ORF Transcript_24197/g.66235 Transcript_24197/m.66235 type:complete len:168 (-) Transcript_24197:652-1155(-)|eukprot:CAMPEP_0202351122 /NCGR_PEP_ID=MMETSP1126-20121109/7907_1 /ASSEMBLY_ACC=CAM_ASM_000457 /TAXON_ID=3047 /ORGANISM="Dunaliella tertiolecta, Strain CCMP1320" /LENGTH=167 /DNA_ID=CAMNT_0048943203 /DNA_START=174 /DNA_END=677 /DNA_ORIENTATION=-